MVDSPAVVGSRQQEAIWSEVERGDGHIRVTARAGCGKTFTCIESLKRLDSFQRSCMLAFNKSIADELRRRAPDHADVYTMHGLGMRALGSAFHSKLDEKKLQRHVRAVVDKITPAAKVAPDTMQAIRSMTAACKNYLLDGDSKSLQWIADRHGLALTNDRPLVFEAVPKVLQACEDDRDFIDFDDMIWLTVRLRLPVRRYDVLFVDESQDLNAAQQQLVKLACPSGRIIIVGDDRQAIYGFRGADSGSMDTLRDMLADTRRSVVDLPLTVTRRCPRSHVELAQVLVPDIQAMPDAEHGTIRCTNERDVVDEIEPPDLVLCRMNAPLVSMAFALVGNGVPVHVRGREWGTALRNLVEKRLRPTNLAHLAARIEQYREEEAKAIQEHHDQPNSALLALFDKCDCLAAMTEQCSSVDDLLRSLDDLFGGNEHDSVVLSTVHRAKGGEADRVFILRPDKIPHPMTEADWEKAQEANLAYVAVTRAKHELIFVGDVPDIFTVAG